MKTGYEMTVGDFVQLLTYPDYREQVAPLIHAWFGYEVRPTSDGFTLRDGAGALIDPETVHERIQADRACQFEIYQTAMSLWR